MIVVFFFLLEAHADFSVLAASRLVKIPEKVSFEQAATAMIQGMTAHYLVHTTGRVTAGTKVLVHAAAGGTGSLLCQVAKNAGILSIALYSAFTSMQGPKLHHPRCQCDQKLITGDQNFTRRRLTLPWLIIIKLSFRESDQE